MEPWNLRRYTREIIAQSESPLQDVSFLKEYFCGMLHGVEDSYVKRSLAIQELALKNSSEAAFFSAASLGAGLVYEARRGGFDVEALESLVDMNKIATICITEKKSGSHILGIRSKAVREGSGWVIDAEKCYIGNAPIADYHGIFVKTSDKNDRNSLTCFLVPAQWPGVEVIEDEQRPGLPGFTMGLVRMSRCIIPDEFRISSVGGGLELSHRAINRHGKPNIGSLALGVNARILKDLKKYASSRELYGKNLLDIQAVRGDLTGCYEEYLTARVLMDSATHALDEGSKNADVTLGLAKLKAAEAAVGAAICSFHVVGAAANEECQPFVGHLLDSLLALAPSGTSAVIRKRLYENLMDENEGEL